MTNNYSGPGHNSGDTGAETGGIAADRLRSIVDRYIRLDDEKKAISSDQKDLLSEAASAGFDKKVIRQLIKIVCAADKDKLQSDEDLLDIYRRAYGV